MMATSINKISELIDLWREIKRKQFSLTSSIISDFYTINKSIVEIQREKNSQESCYFNTFDFFHLDEKMHSHIIAYLLDPTAAHGQSKLFLYEFLKLANISYSKDSQKDNWVVTAEKGRVDVLLKRKNPHSVIIIENKVHNAGDQPNQLYRYWFWEIYRPKSGLYPTYASDNQDRYKIIYLSPSD